MFGYATDLRSMTQGRADFTMQFDRYEEVEKLVLEPNGNFYMEGIKSMSDDAQRAEMMKAIEALTREVKDMRAELATR